MNILVTGGAGFIGSNLCESLLKEDHHIQVIDNFSSYYEENKDPQKRFNNISKCINNSNFRLSEGDIRSPKHIDKCLSDVRTDIIIHLAAKAGVRHSLKNPILYQDVNNNGTLIMLEAARKHKINKFIFASSSSVYGNVEGDKPFVETQDVDHPISPYAATKRCGELMCYTYNYLYNINTTCLRFFTVYGSRQRPDLAIHKFTKCIHNGIPVPLYGDGSMRRDFTYIDDIVNGITRAAQSGSGYRIYNLGGGHTVRLDYLVDRLEEAIGKKATVEYLPVPQGDAPVSHANVSLALKELGYYPKTKFDDGIVEFVQWFMYNQEEETK